MPDKKLTDGEIVKAIPLKKEIEHYQERLKEVFEWYNRRNTNGGEDPLEICVLRDSARLIPKLVDLINRLQEKNSNLTSDLTSLKAENERLKKFALIRNFDEWQATIKAEAYKEFAERLKEKPTQYFYETNRDMTIPLVSFDRIDNILKELVGDK